MTSSSKSDLMSGSPEGHGYPNGQRGPYSAALLERSGSFREGSKSHMMFPPSSSSRLAAGHVESLNLLQSLATDFRTAAVDQKISRPDVKRSISSIFGTSPEEPVSTPSIGRKLPNSFEDIRRMKTNLSDGTNKARERARAFGAAVMRIDRSPNLLRKRSRGDGSSERSSTLLSGGNIYKTVPQGHLNADGVEVGPLRGEDRVKNAVQSRRMRTSIVEMDARTAGLLKGLGPTDRSSDPSKVANGGPAVPEEKIRGLATSIDGWEKPKMKKKRSAIKADASVSVATRPIDGDREQKQGIQHKLGNDTRARVAGSPAFRSGSAAHGPGTGKADLLSMQNGFGGRSFNRSDHDSGFHPVNKRDRQAVLDKEICNLKAVNKPNDREDDSGSNTTPTAKLNGSARGPRSNSSSSLKSSPNIHRLQANSDDWDHPAGTKLNSAGGSSNSKRTKSTHSLSPPTQWGGQRPQKMSRSARKSNLTPITTSNDGTLVSGALDNATVNEDSVGLPRRGSVHAPQQTKRGDHVISTGYEDDEYGVADKKLKDKIKRTGELDDDHGPGFQKIPLLGQPCKRNKLSADEDIGDAARRQGRNGRGFTLPRPSTLASIDKLENTPTTKQRSVRTVTERNERSGRTLVKKLSERKVNARPRHLSNNVQSNCPVQLEDDHDELLAAANTALRSAYPSPFWKQVEPFFGFLTTEDIAYLSQEIHLPDDSTASRSINGDDIQKYKGSLEYISQPSTPAAGSKDDHAGRLNGCGLNEFEANVGIAWERSCVEPILDQLVQGIGVQGGVSICQRLIQSIVDEEKIDNITNIYRSEGYPFDALNVPFEGGCKSHSQGYKLEPLMNFEAIGRSPNGLKADSEWKYHDELLWKSNNVIAKAAMWPEFQYGEMCLNDRILIELSEIGLSFESVPDLAQSEDEDINGEICKLEGELHKKVLEKKSLLAKLETEVKTAKESQQREFSRHALDKLVLAAYEKYMAFCSPNASSSRSVNRASKHAALSFVERTLARCQHYDETGTGCFDEPAFRDMFASATSQRSDIDSASYGIVLVASYNALPKSVLRASTSDASRASSHLTDLSFSKEDPWTNNVKQRELLLDEVVGSITGSNLKTSGFGTSLASNTKGKRSEREREGKGYNRDGTRSGRPSSSNVKGERKNKTKPKQKIANISVSVGSVVSRDTDLQDKINSSDKGKDSSSVSRRDDLGNPSNDAALPDLSNLELPGMDGDFGGWLNIDDDDGLQDLDLMGLQIPMDDINEINIMI